MKQLNICHQILIQMLNPDADAVPHPLQTNKTLNKNTIRGISNEQKNDLTLAEKKEGRSWMKEYIFQTC